MFLGRMVTPGEDPQWLQEDRDKVFAVFADRRERCPSCGVYHDETSEDGMPRNPKLWVATTWRCFVCRDAEKTSEGIPEKERAGVTVHIIRNNEDDEDEEIS